MLCHRYFSHRPGSRNRISLPAGRLDSLTCQRCICPQLKIGFTASVTGGIFEGRLTVKNSQRQPRRIGADQIGDQDEPADASRRKESLGVHDDRPVGCLRDQRKCGRGRIEGALPVGIGRRVDDGAVVRQLGNLLCESPPSSGRRSRSRSDHWRPSGFRRPSCERSPADPMRHRQRRSCRDAARQHAPPRSCPRGGNLTIPPVTSGGSFRRAIVHLVDHRKHDRDSRPQFFAPVQHQFERCRTDRDDDANLPVAIFLLEIPLAGFPRTPVRRSGSSRDSLRTA